MSRTLSATAVFLLLVGPAASLIARCCWEWRAECVTTANEDNFDTTCASVPACNGDCGSNTTTYTSSECKTCCGEQASTWNCADPWTLTCEDNKFKLDLDESINLNTTEYEKYRINDQGSPCEFNWTADYDATIESELTACGTIIDNYQEGSNDYIRYRNEIVFVRVNDNGIYTDSAVNITMTCKYLQRANSSISWTEGVPPNIAADGNGLFTMTLEAFKDHEFQSEVQVTDNIFLGDDLYFEIELLREDNADHTSGQYHILPYHIRAADVDVWENADTSLAFRTAGCFNDDLVGSADLSIISNSSLDDDIIRFSMRAFEFSADPDANVYIHTTIKVCDKNQIDYNACIAPAQCSRKRRAAEEETGRLFHMSSGPYRILSNELELVGGGSMATLSSTLLLFTSIFMF